MSVTFSQEKFEIRLVPTNAGDDPGIVCFDTQFKNTSDQRIELAGQNYRLFYDALQLKYLDDRDVRSYLPASTYDEVDLNQALHNIDARGYGNLLFSQNLGFINYSIRLTEDHSKVVSLPAESGWLSTSNICFQLNDNYGTVSLIWAREGLTDGYATAFTEVSVLDNDELDKPAMIQIYQDYIKLSDGTGVNDPAVLQSTQNH